MIDEKKLLSEIARTDPEIYGRVQNIISRVPTIETPRWTHCGSDQVESASYCEKCGEPIAKGKRWCGKCESEMRTAFDKAVEYIGGGSDNREAFLDFVAEMF